MSELTSTGRATPIDGMHIEYLDDPAVLAPSSGENAHQGAILPTASLLTALSTALDITEGQLSRACRPNRLCGDVRRRPPLDACR